MNVTPNDLWDLLCRTTDDDMPAGVTMTDAGTHEKNARDFRVGNALVATVHRHWMKSEPALYVRLEFVNQDAEVAELLHRIAITTRARVSGEIAEAKDMLRRLNLAITATA